MPRRRLSRLTVPRCPASRRRSAGTTGRRSRSRATSTTSPLDVAAVKQAIDLVHKNRTDEATSVEGTISDPVARKLVEWAILRSDDADLDFSRYAAFIAANPSWPSISTLRRRAEAALWQQQADPRTVIAFFRKRTAAHAPRAALRWRARCWREATSAGAQRLCAKPGATTASRRTSKTQARDMFAGLITPADDKARMDARLYAEDDDAGLRAAQHLGALELAIAKARAAVINKAGNAKALLEEVPAAARHDPGYIFSRIQWLRRSDKIAGSRHSG